jgi:hypothetical protein
MIESAGRGKDRRSAVVRGLRRRAIDDAREVDGEQDRKEHHRDEVTTAIQMSSVSMIAAMLSTRRRRR